MILVPEYDNLVTTLNCVQAIVLHFTRAHCHLCTYLFYIYVYIHIDICTPPQIRS